MDVYLLLVLALLDGAPWKNTGDGRGPANVCSHFVSAVVNEEVAYCPYVKTCVHNYDRQIVDKYGDFNSSCCRPCYSGEVMTCCSDIMPCKQPQTNENNRDLVCIPTTVKRETPEPGMLAIATCKEGADDIEITECLQVYDINDMDVHDIVPVNDVRTHNTYRNIHCALCNEVNRNDIQFWSAYLQCDTKNQNHFLETDIQKLVSGKNGCDIRFKSPTTALTLQQECSHVINQCNDTGEWKTHIPTYETNCLNAANDSTNTFVEAQGMLFRNRMCSLCNPTHGPKSFLDFDFRPPVMSMLLSFNGRQGLDPAAPSTQCRPGMVVHEPKGECIAVRCSLLRHLEGNTCVRTFSLVDNFAYLIDLRLKPDVKLTVRTALELVGLVGTRLFKLLRSVFGNIAKIIFEVLLISDLKYESTHSPSKIKSASLLWYEVHLKLLNSEEHDPERKLQTLLHSASNIGLNVTSPKHNIRFKVLLFDGRDSLVNVGDDSGMQCSSRFTKFKPCTDVPLYTYSFKAPYIDNVTAVRFIGREKPIIAVLFLAKAAHSARNILEMRDCPLVEVSTNQFAWKETNHSIEIRNGLFSINFSDFLYGENETTVWICLNTLYKLEQVRNGSLNSLVNYFDVYMSYLLLLVITNA